MINSHFGKGRKVLLVLKIARSYITTSHKRLIEWGELFEKTAYDQHPCAKSSFSELQDISSQMPETQPQRQ